MQVDKEFKYHNTKEDVSWFTHQILVFMINQHNKDLQYKDEWAPNEKRKPVYFVQDGNVPLLIQRYQRNYKLLRNDSVGIYEQMTT